MHIIKIHYLFKTLVFMKFSCWFLYFCFICFDVVVGGYEYGIYLHYHLDWKPVLFLELSVSSSPSFSPSPLPSPIFYFSWYLLPWLHLLSVMTGTSKPPVQTTVLSSTLTYTIVFLTFLCDTSKLSQRLFLDQAKPLLSSASPNCINQDHNLRVIVRPFLLSSLTS